MSRDLAGQLRRALRPLQVRIANSIARAVVQLVDDSTRLQLLQLGVQAGEDVDDAERVQEYGFASVPLEGAEAVVLFPNGDRAHALVVAVDDRRYRPTGGTAGDVALYTDDGILVRLTAGEVRLGSGTATDPVALKSDLTALKSYIDAHVHSGVTTGGGASGPPASPAPTPAGATKVRGV